MDRLSESVYDMVPGSSGPEYNHLDREQYGKLEDSVVST